MGSILTTLGRNKLASATPENQLTITQIAVGDGNGGYPPLTPSMTSLNNELWRGQASSPIRSQDQSTIIFEGFIPANLGGFFIREVGLFDSEGDLIAVGNTAVIEKPDPASGSAISLSVRIHVALDSASQVDLIITDSPVIDHSGLSNRGAQGSHPAIAISTQALPAINVNAESNVQSVLALLKSGAIKEHQSSLVDSALNKLLLTGAFGLGRGAIVSGDWDSISATGFYTNAESEQPELPISAAELTLIHIQTETNASQFCMRTSSGDPQTWRRSRQGSTWGSWLELQSDGYRAISDANQALKSGFYSLPSSLGAGNAPIFGASGTLIVTQGGADQNYVSQTWIQSNETDEERIFVRHKKLSAWTSWVELHHSGNNDEVGFIKYAITTVTPKGRYIKANGAAVSRTAYADLFAKVGTFWGAGDGSTTFNVPDLRGEFIRSWDDGRGVDAGRAFGSAQGDAIRNITGQTLPFYAAGQTTSSGSLLSTVFGSTPAKHGDIGGDPGANFRIEIDASRQVPTANENRPRNVALIAWIRY